MKKKIFFLAPAAALGFGAILGSGGAIAEEIEPTYIDVTQAGAGSTATFEDCVKNVQENEVCRLTENVIIDGFMIDKSDAAINVDLNDHAVNTGSITLKHGNLNIIGSGEVVNHSDTLPLFVLNGGSHTDENYSVLSIGGGVNLTSSKQSAIDIVGQDDGHGNYRAYGTVVNLAGHINALNGIEIFNVGRSTHGGILPKINIYKDASITATENAILAQGVGSWAIDTAKLETTGKDESAVEIHEGDFIFKDTTITASEGSVFEAVEGAGLQNASISIEGGEYLGLVNFYLEEDVPSQSTLNRFSINGGTFIAENLFNIGGHFNKTNFIESGIFMDWEPAYEDFVPVNGKFKDYTYTADKTILSISDVVNDEILTILPDGYTARIQRTNLTDRDSLASLDLLREKTRFGGEILPQRIDIEVLDDLSTQVYTLNEGVTLKVATEFPELPEGTTRSYYLISCHDSESGFCTEDRVNGVINDDVEYEDGYIIAHGLKEFSSFYIAYSDTTSETPTPTPTPAEEEDTPTTPTTGFEAQEAIERAATGTTSILATVLAGLSVMTLAGVKFFNKKH